MVRSNSTSGSSRPLRPQAARVDAHAKPATVSARWLLSALALTVPTAVLFTWAAFCLLFWQGSWQLLYHPTSTVARTPASIGLAFDSVSFASNDAGVPQLQGWWIPSSTARYTVLHLHGQAGNLGDTLDALADLHASGLNILAFDYRGYGQSHFEHPSEARWLQDANWALEYLTGTRQIDPHSIVIVGSGLGANLALEVAAAHPELAAIVLESPRDSPANAIFNDARAKLLPAHLLVRDRYDLSAPAAALHVPSLWLLQNQISQQAPSPKVDLAFEKVIAQKSRMSVPADQSKSQLLKNWLDSVSVK